MSWKEWPAWLKGGIILSVTYFLLENFVLHMLFFELSLPIININSLFGISSRWLLATGLIQNFVFYFLIGALIGRIFGKIKGKEAG